MANCQAVSNGAIYVWLGLGQHSRALTTKFLVQIRLDGKCDPLGTNYLGKHHAFSDLLPCPSTISLETALGTFLTPDVKLHAH